MRCAWLISILIISIVSPLFAQEYMVLVTKGEVYVENEMNTRNLSAGEVIHEGQMVYLGDMGFVSLVDITDKKVDLYEKGDYSFEYIRGLFEKTEESLYTRLLSKIMNMMTQDQEEKVAVSGVVFRGEESVYSPIDSTVIMDSVITFRFENEFDEKLNISIRNAYTEKLLVQQSTTADSLNIKMDFDPGFFIWQIKDDLAVKSVSFFVIPEEEERNLYIDQYKNLISAMTDWPDSLKQEVTNMWMRNENLLWTEIPVQ